MAVFRGTSATRLRVGLVVLAALTVAIYGVATTAAFHTGGASLKGCVRTDQGQGNIRIVTASTNCLSNEETVRLAKHPAPTGATGPTGATRATGARGPSSLPHTRGTFGSGTTVFGTTPAVVASTALPAAPGEIWHVTAMINVVDVEGTTGAAANWVACQVVVGLQASGEMYVTLENRGADEEAATLTGSGIGGASGSPTDVEIYCYAKTANEVRLDRVNYVAFRIED